MNNSLETTTPWRNASVLAEPEDDWRWMSLRNHQIERVTYEYILDKWKLISGQVVCPPGEAGFVNPLRLSGVGDNWFENWRKQQYQTIALITAISIASLVLTWQFGLHPGIASAFILITPLVIGNCFTAKSRLELAERSEFLVAVINKGRDTIWFVSLIVVLSSFLSGFFLEPFEEVAYRWGAIITNVRDGEFWRVLTGSFVHHNFSHWLVNSVMLVFFFPLVAFYSRRIVFFCFFAGLLISQLSYILLGISGFHNNDLLVGISGGTYALMGFLLVDTLVERRKYPTNFYILLVAFVMMVMVGTMLLNPNASIIAHLSGLLTGAAIAAFSVTPDSRADT